MMLIDNKFNIGDTVYLKTDTDQNPRILTELLISLGTITYKLACGSSEGWHYDFEITAEKDCLKILTN